MDAGYGNNSNLRTEISALGLTYVAGLLSSTTVWAPGTGPLPPKPWSGRGRPPKLMRRNRQHQPAAVKALAIGLPAKAWRTITWRQGTNEKLTSRFARVRVRAAHRDYWQTTPRLEEWLLIEWPKGEDQPTKYWLSTLPEDVAFRTLVETAKSNATIRTSSRRLGSDTSRDAAGAAFIITQRCALRPTDS
ncbi:SRSO17 transposase [Bradyrhizobium sp. USDA 4509]